MNICDVIQVIRGGMHGKKQKIITPIDVILEMASGQSQVNRAVATRMFPTRMEKQTCYWRRHEYE